MPILYFLFCIISISFHLCVTAKVCTDEFGVIISCLDGTEKTPRGPEEQDPCTTQVRDIENIPSECSCEVKNSESKVRQCIADKRACTEDCTRKLNACDNTEENCESFCTPNLNGDAFQEAKDACIQDNKAKIQQQLVQSCTDQIREIQRSGPGGAQLICPGG